MRMSGRGSAERSVALTISNDIKINIARRQRHEAKQNVLNILIYSRLAHSEARAHTHRAARPNEELRLLKAAIATGNSLAQSNNKTNRKNIALHDLIMRRTKCLFLAARSARSAERGEYVAQTNVISRSRASDPFRDSPSAAHNENKFADLGCRLSRLAARWLIDRAIRDTLSATESIDIVFILWRSRSRSRPSHLSKAIESWLGQQCVRAATECASADSNNRARARSLGWAPVLVIKAIAARDDISRTEQRRKVTIRAL